MKTLWIISVGVTDLQFPVWKENECGERQPFRFEIGRASGIRATHENLLQLFKHDNDQIVFPDTLPTALPREDSQQLKLELIQNNGQVLASIDSGSYPHTVSISRTDDYPPNNTENALPVYCSKVHDLIDVAQENFETESVSVVVLNTCRMDQRDEPIASGPLVAAYLAQKLGLQWTEQNGAIPEELSAGTSTWINILKDDERLEDNQAQQNVIKRLTAAIRAWNPEFETENHKIIVTTTGGMGPLKPLIERIPATCLGQQAVSLLERPERALNAEIKVLNYLERISERETLRFHCAESLRKRDYISAYALARRYPHQPWADAVKKLLGPLLELEVYPVQVNGQTVSRLVLTACQIEMSLCMGDSVNALRRMSVFIEAGVWELIPSDTRVIATGLQIDRIGGYFRGQLENDHLLITQKLVTRHNNAANLFEINGLTWIWPGWLNQHAGGQIHRARDLFDFVTCYNRNEGENSPRDFRNLLAHGNELNPIHIGQLNQCLQQNRLINGIGKPFGENFLATNNINGFLNSLGVIPQIEGINNQLNKLITTVIERVE